VIVVGVGCLLVGLTVLAFVAGYILSPFDRD
jgi:hypothetical protein